MRHRLDRSTGVRALACAGVALLVLGGVPAHAQSSSPPEAGERSPYARPGQSPAPAPSQERGRPQSRDEGGTGTGEKSDSSAKAKPEPLKATPQTAEEKTRLLSDLYAQLATAEDETAAKPLVSAIQRLWSISGSDTVTLLLRRAAGAAQKKENELALKLFDYAVALAPDYAEAFNQRAFFYFSQNNFEAAVGDLRRVLALDPNHFKALEGLAQIMRETGNKKGAYQVLQQLLDVHPFSPGAKSAYDELKRDVEGQGI